MKIINESEYLKAKDTKDAYTLGIIKYAETWADLMEEKINSGEKIDEFAEETSYTAADHEGITGFMHGMAVEFLVMFWEYGEQLRKWHNLKYNLNGEGERANKKGTVINPAIISGNLKDE